MDAFIKTTKDYVICGAGLSESQKADGEGGSEFHHSQRQHIYSIPKKDLKPTEFKPV